MYFAGSASSGSAERIRRLRFAHVELARARKAYGLPESFNSYPSKVLVFNREVQPGRVKVILMNEDAGF